MENVGDYEHHLQTQGRPCQHRHTQYTNFTPFLQLGRGFWLWGWQVFELFEKTARVGGDGFPSSSTRVFILAGLHLKTQEAG